MLTTQACCSKMLLWVGIEYRLRFGKKFRYWVPAS